jgi:outer membrane protein insertion porin family
MAVRHFASAVLLSAFLASGCKEEGGVKVTSFAFKGTRAVTSSQLKGVLATHASAKLPWGTKHYFSREQFDADLKRIVAFYRDRGYPDARVTSFDVKLNPDQTSVALTVDIAEGEPLRVERIDYQGFEPLPAQHRKALETQVPLKAGAPLDRALLQASREAALDELRDHGYPYASVRVSEENGASPRQRVIAFTAEPGPLTMFGPIEVNGNRSVSDRVIERQLSFRPGRMFRQSAIQDSQRKLYGQELFQFANVEPIRGDGQPPDIPMRVTVTEGSHRKVNLGVGYGSEEKARTQIDWRHVNFFGGARTAGVFARYSSLDRGVRLHFNEPYLFNPRLSLDLTGQSWHSDEPAFTLDTNGGRFIVTRRFRRSGGPVLGSKPATSISFGYILEHERYQVTDEALADPDFRDDLIALGFDPRTGKGNGTRSALLLEAGRNTTNNILDAKRGYIATVHLEQAGRLAGGTYDYFELTGEGRVYRGFGRGLTAAIQAKAGSIDAFGSQEDLVPFSKRYFLGGATSLRGWGRYEVSPLTEDGLPIGGGSFVSFSTELRAPLWGKLGGVVFLDAGNAWTNPWDINLTDLRYDVGPGLRYSTPIGPIRVDFGYQLNPIPGLIVNGEPQKRRYRFHFSIGQAF